MLMKLPTPAVYSPAVAIASDTWPGCRWLIWASDITWYA